MGEKNEAEKGGPGFEALGPKDYRYLSTGQLVLTNDRPARRLDDSYRRFLVAFLYHVADDLNQPGDEVAAYCRSAAYMLLADKDWPFPDYEAYPWPYNVGGQDSAG